MLSWRIPPAAFRWKSFPVVRLIMEFSTLFRPFPGSVKQIRMACLAAWRRVIHSRPLYWNRWLKVLAGVFTRRVLLHAKCFTWPELLRAISQIIAMSLLKSFFVKKEWSLTLYDPLFWKPLKKHCP